MNRFPPKPFDEPCGRAGELVQGALEVIAKSVEVAAGLRATIEKLNSAGPPPIAPHRPGFNLSAWKVLAAYLVEERRLIEFLLGPVQYRDNVGNWRRRNPDDICLDCFTPSDRPWRFEDQGVRDELHDRASRINGRLTHFSWTLVAPDVRADTGFWNTHYFDRVLDGLLQFADHLETVDSSLATSFRNSLGGPPDATAPKPHPS